MIKATRPRSWHHGYGQPEPFTWPAKARFGCLPAVPQYLDVGWLRQATHCAASGMTPQMPESAYMA